MTSFLLASTESMPAPQGLGPVCSTIFISSIIATIDLRMIESIEVVEDIKPLNERDFIATITSYLLDAPDLFEADENQAWQDLDPYKPSQETQDPYVLKQEDQDPYKLKHITLRQLASDRAGQDYIDAEGESWKTANPNSFLTLIANARFGGSMFDMKEYLQKLAMRYVRSNPGPFCETPNYFAHPYIVRMVAQPKSLRYIEWEWLFIELHYRTRSIAVAERHLQNMGIQARAANHVNMEAWEDRQPEMSQKSEEDWYALILDLDLFPDFPGLPLSYQKPMIYMAAVCTSSGLPKYELKRRLRIARDGKRSSLD